MDAHPLPYPLPPRSGFGEKLTSLLPRCIQDATRSAFDHLAGERLRLETVHLPLALPLGPDAPATCRIGLLSDFHYDPLCEAAFMTRCVQIANQQNLDLVLLLGDFASNHAGPVTDLATILSHLRSRWGTFAVLGNHDHIAGAEQVSRALDRAGIRVLRNALARVETGDGSLLLAGMESATYGCPDLSLLNRARPYETALALCHEPDVFLHSRLHPCTALQVSGHSHGGQVRLPLLGSPLLPRLGAKFTRGLYESGSARLYVNRGIGTGHIHVRWGAAPELTVLHIRNRALPFSAAA